MYPILHELLSDRKGGKAFACFGVYHWCYILLAVLAAILAAVKMGKLDAQNRERELDRWINLAFGLYIADFFLMPFAYEAIDLEKLPFHVCTAMCVACFLSRRWEPLKPWQLPLATLGFVSNLVYLIYPAGIMWQGVHPLCYRVAQTLSFHAIMAVYGFLTLCYGQQPVSCKNWRKDLTVITAMTGWAVLGNTLYNGKAGGYNHFFNWFFVVRDPFCILPEAISPWVMPLVNIGVFFSAELLIITVFSRICCDKGTHTDIERRNHHA